MRPRATPAASTARVRRGERHGARHGDRSDGHDRDHGRLCRPLLDLERAHRRTARAPTSAPTASRRRASTARSRSSRTVEARRSHQSTFFDSLTKTASFGTGESVTWTPTLVTTAVGALTRYKWTISSVGTVPNPTGAGSISRTVTADVRLKPTTTQTIDASAWRYVYSWKTGRPRRLRHGAPEQPERAVVVLRRRQLLPRQQQLGARADDGQSRRST